MKKYYLLSILICTLVFASPHISLADSDHPEDDGEVSTSTSSSVDYDDDDKADDDDSDNDDSIRVKNRSRLEVRNENGTKFRQDIRQDIRGIATGTRAEIKDIRTETRIKTADMRIEEKMRIKNASSSMERREIKNNARRDIFKARQTKLVTQLELALNNLKQIRSRIISRIEKAETSGRTMTEARELMTVVDTKIATAVQEIATLAAYTPTTTATSTTENNDDDEDEVDLEKPRRIGESAIKAVKEVRKALVDVIVSIAHNMGVRCDKDGDAVRCNATTTVETTSTTTTP